MRTYIKSGLSPQLIMRASLARHIAEVAKRTAGEENTPHWQTPDYHNRAGESEIENLGWAEGYAEKGYTEGARGVLTANWNYFTRDLTRLLERAGFECEWSDEWDRCGDCGKLVRTQGDSYDWQPYYILAEGDITCLDCVDWSEYLESIEDNPRAACMRACDPGKYGYVLLSGEGEYENGFHPGQNDDPSKILKALQANGEKHIVFRVSTTSQFYIEFEVWQRAVTIERVIERLEDAVQTARERYYQDAEDVEGVEYQNAKQTLAMVAEIARRAESGEVKA